MNVMNINERQPVPASCFTEKYGTYQCIIAVREMLQREFSTLPTDAQIERYLRSLQADMGERYQKVIGTTAKEYVAEIFRRLREHNYDPALMRLWARRRLECLWHSKFWPRAKTADGSNRRFEAPRRMEAAWCGTSASTTPAASRS